MTLPRPPLLLITDRSQTRRPVTEVVSAALQAGCRWVSLREKDLPAGERLALARELVALAGADKACFMVHDDLEAAAATGSGCHLPRNGDVAAARARLGQGALIGVSAHNLAEARRAEEAGADYVTFSPVFPSRSKPGYGDEAGLDRLAKVVEAVSLPVIALGGVTEANATDCLSFGARGVAVMGRVMGAEEPAEATSRIVRALQLA